MASNSKTPSFPAPYKTNNDQKRAGLIFQPFVGTDYTVTRVMMECITRIDTELYSNEFRTHLATVLAPHANTEVITFVP
jgi:hypothetical protein